MKWFTILFIPAVVGAGFLYGDPKWVDSLRPQKAPSAAPVAKSKASRPRTTKQIFAAGVIEGADREVPLDFEIEGRLIAVLAVEGTAVREGDELARLDDSLATHKLAEAEAQLSLARAEYERLVNGASEEARRVARAEADLAATFLEHAESGWKRAQQLIKENALSKERADAYEYGMKQAAARFTVAKSHVDEVEAAARLDERKISESKIRVAETAVAQAREMKQKAILRAPCNGVILNITAEPGELLGPGRTESLITMANLDSMHARAYVEELDALELEVGQNAWVAADGRPGHRFTGCLVWIAPFMNEKRMRHYKPGERLDVKVREVLMRVDDPEGLVVGLPVDMFIERKRVRSESQQAAVSMPRAAQTESPDVSSQ
jgi:multidrug resistance efflux pump